MFAQFGKRACNFFIALHVAMEHQIRTQTVGQLAHALFQLVHGERERQFRALFMTRLGNAVCNRAVGNHARNQNLLTL